MRNKPQGSRWKDFVPSVSLATRSSSWLFELLSTGLYLGENSGFSVLWSTVDVASKKINRGRTILERLLTVSLSASKKRSEFV